MLVVIKTLKKLQRTLRGKQWSGASTGTHNHPVAWASDEDGGGLDTLDAAQATLVRFHSMQAPTTVEFLDDHIRRFPVQMNGARPGGKRVYSWQGDTGDYCTLDGLTKFLTAAPPPHPDPTRSGIGPKGRKTSRGQQ